MKCTMIADIPSEVLLLSASDLWVMSKEIREDFLDFGIRIPSDKELRQMYFVHNRWKKFQKLVFKKA
jgi:hypothetical protein